MTVAAMQRRRDAASPRQSSSVPTACPADLCYLWISISKAAGGSIARNCRARGFGRAGLGETDRASIPVSSMRISVSGSDVVRRKIKDLPSTP